MIRSNIRQVVRGLSKANVRQFSIMRSSPLCRTIQFKGVARTSWLTRSYVVSTDGEDISNKIDNISANEYNNIANLYLETLADELEMVAEDFPEVDCELSQGVMTLTIPSNGTYVINKQPPNKQIWLSSPISGPKRYDLIQGKWVTLRDNSSLTELLKEEISQALGQEIDLPLEN